MRDQVLVRGLDTGVKPALQRQAALHGVSLEQYLRDTLRRVAFDAPEDPVLEWLDGSSALPDGPDFVLPERGAARTEDLFA